VGSETPRPASSHDFSQKPSKAPQSPARPPVVRDAQNGSEGVKETWYRRLFGG
jgi:hypothetical protein